MKNFNDDHLYNFFRIGLKFRERVYGGIPKSSELIDKYVSSKFGVENTDLAEKLKEEVGLRDEEVDNADRVEKLKEEADLKEELEKVTTGFKVKDGEPYISNYQIKAMLKQAANRLKITSKKKGAKQDIVDGLFLADPKVFLKVNGNLAEQPLPTEEFAGHVTTPHGKRSILKASEYVEEAYAEFVVRLIHTSILSPKELLDCFLLGQEIGLGSNRSFETGKYDLEVFEKTEPGCR